MTMTADPHRAAPPTPDSHPDDRPLTTDPHPDAPTLSAALHRSMMLNQTSFTLELKTHENIIVKTA
jgi:hypothetical protein